MSMKLSKSGLTMSKKPRHLTGAASQFATPVLHPDLQDRLTANQLVEDLNRQRRQRDQIDRPDDAPRS